MSGRQKLRCAVYTRKSSDEGLHQDFNSLDAQREACAAFIASQTGLGWSLVPDLYDDGGVSGGTMDRPALQRLLQDIRDHRIDVVVVYKIDRLTRSLMDFSKIVETFDASDVSFVSVTQQFNTTTSMGRLTLNVLLSFAQFEREVTAERIRDKIAASKKKGMWMGGRVPLGYKVVDRKLVIGEAGAERVRHLFRRYLDLKSVAALAIEINSQLEVGNQSPSQSHHPMSRGQLYHLLSNPIYIGKLRHRDQVYDGAHQAILDPDLFERVQALLAGQAPKRKSRRNAPDVHLLTGLLFDETGDRLSPAHANNHGKRYRYYVSARLKTGDGNKEGGWRIAASELERIVEQQLREILEDRTCLAGWIQEEASSERIASGLAAAERMILHLDTSDSSEGRRTILRTAFRRITVSSSGIRFVIDRHALVQHIVSGEGSRGNGAVSHLDSSEPDEGSVIDRVITIKRRGVEARIVVNNGNGHREPDRSIVDLVARAHLYLDRLTGESHPTIPELAGQFSVHPADISRVLPLAFLSPAITDAILTGRQPSDLTARTLARLIDLPPMWTDQATAIGL